MSLPAEPVLHHRPNNESLSQFERLVGPDTNHALLAMMQHIVAAAPENFRNALLAITDTGQIQAHHEDLLDRVPASEREMIARSLRDLTSSGSRIAFLGPGVTPEDNIFFHVIGAHPRNVGSVFLFVMSFERFRQIASLTQEQGNGSVSCLRNAIAQCARTAITS